MRPVVVLTTYREPASWGGRARSADLLPADYVDALVRAGGAPLLAPPVPEAAEAVIAAAAALVLTGGSDVDPASYRAPAHPRTDRPRHDRDRSETALLRAALDAGRPVLAICRGVQLLNVALGGSLVQHLPDLGIVHQAGADDYAETAVRVQPDTRLAGIVGAELTVRCHHHQALASLGRGLLPVAWAGDGTVEAVELPGRPFVIGVQWHPERGSDPRLFEALVAAAGNQHLPRSAVQGLAGQS